MPINMIIRGFKKRYVIRDARGRKGSFEKRRPRDALYGCSYRVRSLFSGIVTRCANTGFPRVTIPRAYVRIARMEYTLHRSTGTDSRARFSISLVHYAQGLNRLYRFDIQLRHALITYSNQTSRSRLVPVISRKLTDNVLLKFMYRNLILLDLLVIS